MRVLLLASSFLLCFVISLCPIFVNYNSSYWSLRLLPILSKFFPFFSKFLSLLLIPFVFLFLLFHFNYSKTNSNIYLYSFMGINRDINIFTQKPTSIIRLYLYEALVPKCLVIVFDIWVLNIKACVYICMEMVIFCNESNIARI